MIDSFTGEYFFLSNFYEHPIDLWDDRPAKSGEHLFQALKTMDVDEQDEVLRASTPGKAKRLGRMVTLVENWDEDRIGVMRFVLRCKFEDPELRQKLIDTYPNVLEEGNTWGDTYWGKCNGVGENHLGRLLMELRDELMNEEVE